MVLTEKIDPSDPLKFLLKSTDRNPSRSDVSFICQGADVKDRDEWVFLIRHLLQAQKDFLLAIQSPIAYQKEKTKNMTHSQSMKTPQEFEASTAVNTRKTDILRRQSEPVCDNNQSEIGEMSPKTKKSLFKIQLKSRRSDSRRLSSEVDVNRSPSSVKSEEESIPIEAGMNVKVLLDFNAFKEDEISVTRGEVLQVLSCNSVRGYLVHRPASSTSPAAEGWVPSHVLLPPPLSPTDNAAFFPSGKSNISPNRKVWLKQLRKQTSIDFGRDNPSIYNPQNSSGLKYIGRNYPYLEAFSGPVKFVIPLQNTSVRCGDPVVLTCRASGPDTLALNTMWFGPRGELVDPRFEVEQHRDGTSQVHFAARKEDSGEYTCVVTYGEFSVSTSGFLKVVS